MPRITAENFYSDMPPERIIGTECEYTVQGVQDLAGHVTPVRYYCDANAVAAAGYSYAATEEFDDNEPPKLFLDNGGKIHPEVKRLVEYCSPESLGPVQGTYTDMAGILVVRKIVAASGFQHRGVSRRTGYAHAADNLTTGYHENYLIPRNLCRREYLYKLLPAFLATKVWGGNGAVGPGYELSQKHRGIGDTVATEMKNQNRLTEGRKPMVLLRDTENSDDDVNPSEEWARCEVRFADANLSPLQTYVGLAATSLVLRLCEHDTFVSARLEDAILSDPVESAHQIARDPSFTTILDSHGGGDLTALDIQGRFLDDIKRMASYVKLPASEVNAIAIWDEWLTTLRAIQMKDTDLSALSDALDVAAKYYYLSRSQHVQESGGISAENSRAVKADLLWEQILPDGFGLRHWRKILLAKGMGNISLDNINRYVGEPPRRTRAYLRARAVASSKIDIVDLSWSHLRAFPAEKTGGKIRHSWDQPFLARSS